jgi:4-hydroxybenzoate polyprenyltransferase
MLLDKLKITLQMIKFEHTVFALPFALISTLLAAKGLPSARQTVWILVAMVAARSAAMTFNRIVDVGYDRANPRTQNRALVTGTLSMSFAVCFTVAMSAAFILAAGMLNPVCLILSFPVLAILLSYSYFKRFTSLSHLMLGFAIGLAPLGAWLAVRGQPGFAPLLIGAAVMCWIAGFDIVYACQDIEVDRRNRLYSLPATWGPARALRVSSALHVATIVVLIVMAWMSDLGVVSYSGIALTAGILAWEHHIVRPDDLSRVDVAFFNLNGYVGLLLFATVATDVLLV